MTNEKLNTALYKKVFAEQEQCQAWLKNQSPGEILNHCYKHVVQQNIVLSMEEHDLSNKRCKALLKSQVCWKMCSKTFKGYFSTVAQRSHSDILPLSFRELRRQLKTTPY